MQTIRRLYVYFMSAVTLTVTLVGAAQLLRVVLVAIGVNGDSLIGGTDSREQVSLAAALIGVGLPVWGIHWYLAERSVRGAGSADDIERAGATRAVYLTLVLAVTLAVGVLSALALLQPAARSILGGERVEYLDVASALSALLVAAPAWAYHVSIRRRDMRAGALAGAAASVPRLYLYGASFLGLILASIALSQGLATSVNAALGALPAFGGTSVRSTVADQAAAVVVWSTVWLGHWWYASRLSRDPGWRGQSERVALLRMAYLLLAIGATGIGTALFAVTMLQGLLAGILGVASLGDVVTGSPVAAAVAGLAGGAPWAAAAALHLLWLREESAGIGAGRAAAADRLLAGILGGIGVAFTAIGVAWLLGLGIEQAMGGDRLTGDDARAELARYLGMAIVGGLLWAWGWRRLQARRTAAPLPEAASLTRRAYLLAILAGSIIGSLGSLAVVLYRVFGAIMGVGFDEQLATTISGPLGVLVTAAAIAAYHGLALRRDQALRATEGSDATSAPEHASAHGASHRLVLRAPAGADVEATLTALRADLPAGYSLEAD